MTRPRHPSAEELRLWRDTVREVRPLAGRRPQIPRPDAEAQDPAAAEVAAGGVGHANGGEGPAPAAPAAKARRSAAARSAPPALPPITPESLPGLDRRTAQRVRRGEVPIEARIDLHGLIQAEAHRALIRFVEESHHAGRRMVLVITGKGTSRDGAPAGILRTQVPRWLNEPPLRPRLAGFHPARPQHGGDGAFYLLLRRRRDDRS